MVQEDCMHPSYASEHDWLCSKALCSVGSASGAAMPADKEGPVYMLSGTGSLKNKNAAIIKATEAFSSSAKYYRLV